MTAATVAAPPEREPMLGPACFESRQRPLVTGVSDDSNGGQRFARR
jgi:hypothetical protein